MCDLPVNLPFPLILLRAVAAVSLRRTHLCDMRSRALVAALLCASLLWRQTVVHMAAVRAVLMPYPIYADPLRNQDLLFLGTKKANDLVKAKNKERKKLQPSFSAAAEEENEVKIGREWIPRQIMTA